MWNHERKSMRKVPKLKQPIYFHRNYSDFVDFYPISTFSGDLMTTPIYIYIKYLEFGNKYFVRNIF